jgi:hypothetical protein
MIQISCNFITVTTRKCNTYIGKKNHQQHQRSDAVHQFAWVAHADESDTI